MPNVVRSAVEVLRDGDRGVVALLSQKIKDEKRSDGLPRKWDGLWRKSRRPSSSPGFPAAAERNRSAMRSLSMRLTNSVQRGPTSAARWQHQRRSRSKNCRASGSNWSATVMRRSGRRQRRRV
jgi:hypothetical protein